MFDEVSGELNMRTSDEDVNLAANMVGYYMGKKSIWKLVDKLIERLNKEKNMGKAVAALAQALIQENMSICTRRDGTIDPVFANASFTALIQEMRRLHELNMEHFDGWGD